MIRGRCRGRDVAGRHRKSGWQPTGNHSQAANTNNKDRVFITQACNRERSVIVSCYEFHCNCRKLYFDARCRSRLQIMQPAAEAPRTGIAHHLLLEQCLFSCGTGLPKQEKMRFLCNHNPIAPISSTRRESNSQPPRALPHLTRRLVFLLLSFGALLLHF